MLEFFVYMTVAVTGMTCAAHDTGQNKAVFASPTIPLVSTTYADRGRLIYRAAPKPNQDLAWIALHANERALQYGKPGRKVHIQCVA